MTEKQTMSKEETERQMWLISFVYGAPAQEEKEEDKDDGRKTESQISQRE